MKKNIIKYKVKLTIERGLFRAIWNKSMKFKINNLNPSFIENYVLNRRPENICKIDKEYN